MSALHLRIYLQWVVLVVLVSMAWSGAVVKPGCPSSCGNNVPIPFPFGIGNNCSLNSRYAIDCFSTKPFLRIDTNKSVEVVTISEQNSTMVVHHPEFPLVCPKSADDYITMRLAVDLSGSPFFYSETENVLSGLGCGNFARIYTNGTIAGCFTSCDEKAINMTDSRKGCFGNHCCQTMIPVPLQTFSTSVWSMPLEHRNICKRTILVQEKWLIDNTFKVKNDVRAISTVPVVLGWGILDVDHPISKNLSSTNSHCSNVTISSATYENYTSPDLVVRQCFCNHGYQGNAYLSNGCQDIDECEDTSKPACPGMNCINRIGYHECFSTDPPPTSSSITVLGIVVGIISSLLLIIGGWRGYITLNKRKDKKLKETYFKRNGGLLLQQQLTSFDGGVDRSKIFNARELDKATDHFNVNRILGQGGQGTVYKGMLIDGQIVAIKKSKVIDETKIEEFINEVAILSQINHRNVVRLLGCCLETEVPSLVYEFIPNGTLFQYLHHQSEEFSLTWEMRLRIATEIAGALFYLHSAARLPIYHRDIKSSNILLDDKYRAKIADFGTSKSLSTDQTHVTTKVMGTLGYLDPEYFQSHQYTDKSDVYSFGVVLVELLTGQEPISLKRSQENRNLVLHFIVSMEENKVFEILDSEVMKGEKEEVVTTAELAKRCLNLNGKKRPTMKEAASVLEGILKSQNKTSDVATSSTFEEVEYVRTEVIEPWDVVSNSTSSTFEVTISSGAEPLLN